MGRPQSTDGGRPISLTVRLSTEEAAQIDALRGSLSRSAYLRTRIGPEKVNSHPLPPERTTRPAAIVDRVPATISEPANPLAVGAVSRLSELPDGTPVPVTVGGVVPEHRHRRGQEIGRAYDKGVPVKQYACVQAGCPKVLE